MSEENVPVSRGSSDLVTVVDVHSVTLESVDHVPPLASSLVI